MRVNTAMFFRSVPENIARGLSNDGACEVGAMTKDTVPVLTEKTILFIYWQDRICIIYLLTGYVKKLPKRNYKLFGFSENMNKEGL